MNKLLLNIILFISFAVYGQTKSDTISVSEAVAEQIYFEEQKIQPKSFRENFEKDYTSEEFQYNTVVSEDTSGWDNFKAWLAYWLDRIFSFGNGPNASVLEVVIKILALLVVLFVVYLIARAIINKEGKWIFGRSSKKSISTNDVFTEDIHNIDFRSIIEKSKQANNHRLSIRYYYLWLLKRMSDSSIIEWDIEKTNSDYLYEIKRPSLKEEFQYLSYIYDYSWYGEFTIDEALFVKAEKAFVKTINSI